MNNNKDFHIPTEEDEKAFIEDVARKCVASLSEKDKQAFRDDPDPINYHFGYGMYIRNKYIHGKAFPNNLFLLDADGVSQRILERIIEIVNEE